MGVQQIKHIVFLILEYVSVTKDNVRYKYTSLMLAPIWEQEFKVITKIVFVHNTS